MVQKIENQIFQLVRFGRRQKYEPYFCILNCPCKCTCFHELMIINVNFIVSELHFYSAIMLAIFVLF